MSEKLLLYISITVVMVMTYILFNQLKKSYVKKMSEILYVDNDVDTFLEKLNGFEGQIYLDKKNRLFRTIDAYAIKNDHDGVIETYQKLEGLKLSFGQKVNLYEKEVNYYIEHKMYDEAIKANEKMQELGAMATDIEDVLKVVKDCDALCDIYINKDGSYASIMADLGDKATNDTIKGTYYYRAAKCYYYKRDNKQVEKYLKKALNCLNKTSWAQFIESALKDNTLLEEK